MKSQEMYIIVFGIFIIKLQTSVSEPEFPPHIDLQKVGEAIFNNEKFNILKPTTHKVTDHFKEFMLRTESNYHPAKRVFIDHNGFRHDWSGFGEKTKSLRKTDLKHIRANFETASENTPDSDKISKDSNNNTATVDDISDNNVSSNENENNNQEVEKNASDINFTVHNLTEESTEAPEGREITTIINLFPTIQKKNNSSTNITIEERLRQSEDDAKDKKLAPASKEDGKKEDKRTGPGDKAKKDDKHKDKTADEKEKTVATTTFFCPYFGMITMSAFID